MPRNFPAPTRRAREAQQCAARLPALSPARRDRAPATQAASSRTAAAARAAYPDVPAPSCALSRESPASPDLLRDLGIAAGPPPGRGGYVHCCGTPRKLRGSSRLLSRRDLAPRAGDTSGRLRAPRLPEDRHGQRPPSTASSSPADRAPPSARPSPAPPPAETPARAHNQGGKTLRGVGWGVPLQSPPGAEDLGCPSRQSQVPSTQSRSPSRPPSLCNFPFSSSDRSDPLPGLPTAKTGAGSPLPATLLSGLTPVAEQRPAAGLDLPTSNLGQACH